MQRWITGGPQRVFMQQHLGADVTDELGVTQNIATPLITTD